jgi:DNA repair exonuclease SbcCD ATPase subunit
MAEQSDVLSKQIAYSGDRMSVKSLEEGINTVRSRQNVKVGELKALRERNIKLQESLADEIKKLRKFSDYLSRGELGGGFLSNLKEILSYIPILNKLSFTRRSIEELLRQQYEISARRVKEAAEFADKLKTAESDLHDEIQRLNDKIIEAAKNEDVAAAYVLELQELKKDLDAKLEAAAESSTEQRELQAQQDQLRRLMGEHSTQLQLFHSAEDRLARLKENSRMLAETIANLASDITQYVNAASEKLDLASGQIQAIGTAADASVVMLELKKSLDVMTDSMNQTTQFVSETQAFFRANLDKLMDELELYDDETQKVMEKNLQMSREIEENRIAEAVQVALDRAKEATG